jgi:hypothetical protein
MQPAQGYYSLIQYCPDLTRLEAATVGVLLFCPERAFLKALTARDNRRIQRFFGREGHDWRQINSFKKAIEERVVVEQPNIQGLEDLQQFIALRANDLQITPPRAMRVENPEEDLKALVREIVGGEPGKPRRGSLLKFVGDRLLRAGLDTKLARDVDVVVPVFGRPTTIPFGFQNGRFQLIQPARFEAENVEHSLNTACRYAVEGRSLYEHRHASLGDLQLVVVGKFRSQDEDTRNRVRNVLAESQVDLFALGELDRLIDEIRRTGKELPDVLRS